MSHPCAIMTSEFDGHLLGRPTSVRSQDQIIHYWFFQRTRLALRAIIASFEYDLMSLQQDPAPDPPGPRTFTVGSTGRW